jgi:hypothetical protein
MVGKTTCGYVINGWPILNVGHIIIFEDTEQAEHRKFSLDSVVGRLGVRNKHKATRRHRDKAAPKRFSIDHGRSPVTKTQ